MLPLFIQACRQISTDRTPVWFMRQAGRYMPEYRAIRKDHPILEICKTPRLASEVTMQPIEALDVDAAIIFADLLLPLEPMGLNLEFVAGDGPKIHNPVRTTQDIDRLQVHRTAELNYVGEALSLTRAALPAEKALIGFVGAPFTLASYMIEGGSSRHYAATKRMMYSDKGAWDALMEKIIQVITPFAASQAAGGADVIQIFDSWVGALSPGDFETYVLPHTRMLVRQVQTIGVPVIYFGTGASSYLPLLHQAGADVLGLDWRIQLDEGWKAIGYEAAVQGNLDPIALLGPPAGIESRVADILQRAGGRAGHIFNLGHGIIPETPVEHVKAVVRAVREFRLAV
ncbi:MAG: uroporphyrinogen decarboxylase [Acidobacteria bacterium]|nr:uroporphyrinogen decarboxylase [Acidobacteriota bacterium]MDA1235851.1 uroporphyrinogen decarboxylase [Acidobacteriota bacterium]